MVAEGALIAAVTAVAFALEYRGDDAPAQARTAAFCTLAGSQLFYAFVCRSRRYTLPQLGLFTNRALVWAIAISGSLQLLSVVLPFASRVFKTTPGLQWRWALVLGLSLVPAAVVELGKILVDRARRP